MCEIAAQAGYTNPALCKFFATIPRPSLRKLRVACDIKDRCMKQVSGASTALRPQRLSLLALVGHYSDDLIHVRT
jgi:hypothetical protein